MYFSKLNMINKIILTLLLLFIKVLRYIKSKKFSSYEECKKYCLKQKNSFYTNDKYINLKFKKFLQISNHHPNNLEYSSQLLNKIILIYIEKYKTKPKILDFGGNFGENYFYLDKSFNTKIHYDVCEVKEKTEKCKNLNNVNFYSDLNTALKNNYDIIYISGTLQYLEHPYANLKKILQTKPKIIGLTRNNFCDRESIYAQATSLPLDEKDKIYFENFNLNKLIKIFNITSNFLYLPNRQVSLKKIKRMMLDNQYSIYFERKGKEGNFGYRSFSKDLIITKDVF